MKRISLALVLVFFFTLYAGLLGCAPSNPSGQVPQPPPIIGGDSPAEEDPPVTVDPPEEEKPPIIEEPPEEEEKVSKVRFYNVPAGVDKYEKAEVYVGGVQLPLYGVNVNTSQEWTPNNYKRTLSGVGLFELDGIAEIKVKRKNINEKSIVRPLSADITPIADTKENTLTFTLKSAGDYVLEINGNKDDAIHLFVSDYEEEADKSGYKNLIYFGAGLHTAKSSSYIKSDNSVTVNSNTLVYLDDGAVVRAKFVANNASNIAIKGRGIIDGSTFERDAEKGTVTVPIDFNYCKNAVLEDFTVLDPAGWCVNFYFNDGAEINGIKIITSRSNGDGISLQSCKNITVENCFVRTWDDSLVVKNYPQWSDRSKHGSTDNILFKNCTIWTDLAQSMEIGYETVGQTLKNVTFENITVLHTLHQAAISIHNANNADIKDITFKDITIEDGTGASEFKGNIGGIIDIQNLYSSNWSEVHTTTALGSISGVNIQNVKIISAPKLSMTLGGCKDTRKGYESTHQVDGLTINGISLSNKLPSLGDCVLNNTGYLKNFSFNQNIKVTGAEFISSRTKDYLSKFGTECTVEFMR